MKHIACVAALVAALVASADVTVSNRRFTLVLGDDATAKSLVLKATGEELVDASLGTSLFSVTQDRFFNNEIKLAYQCRQVTLPANSLRRDGDDLVVGFETVPYRARVHLRIDDDFVGFEFAEFLVGPTDYLLSRNHSELLDMKLPPAKAFRLVQLPVREREHFGEWLNVASGGGASVAVIAAEPFTAIDNERRGRARLLTADASDRFDMAAAKAVVVAAPTSEMMECVKAVEEAYGLPRGVEGRNPDVFNRSIYWTSQIGPSNFRDHIAFARKGGFRRMLIYHTAICAHSGDYSAIGSYALRKEYAEGIKSAKAMIDEIKAAGFDVGLHVLHSFVGFGSSYVTPVADHRLNITRRFTLSRPIPAEGEVGEIFVEESPVNCPTNATCRLLKFGGELFTYESFNRSRPYRFSGVRRGAKRTRFAAHALGEIGGILDVCEFGAGSCYVDQDTSLQDELAEKIASIYNGIGFDFLCMDGCEGVSAPHGINVANAQYKVWRRLRPEPLFSEGAAKAHFDWHFLTGANAFDVFPPEEFKEQIVCWPQSEAAALSHDFSSVSFGWWRVYLPGWKFPDGRESVGTQYDMWEFGTSRAAGWDCPTTIQFSLNSSTRHPRIDDLMEVMRRWEDVRARKWLTPEQKAALRSPSREHHLYVNERGEYELFEIEMLPTPAAAPFMRGFAFEREGRRIVAYWHTSGAGRARIDLGDGAVVVPVDKLRYLDTALPMPSVRKSFAEVSDAH